jgi:hypothetical protein
MSNVQSIFKKINKQNDELKHKNEIEIKETLDKEEIIKKYDFNYEVEEDILEFLKEQTYQIHLTSNVFYTKLGKIFMETQEKLANNKNGVFRKWFENIGFKKDFVYDNITRYKYIVGNSDNIKSEIESLPVTLTYEIAKESCPDSIRERVISGEIRTQSELKKAIKEIKKEKEAEIEEVQEAEIVESLNKFIIGEQCILNALKTAMEKIKKGSNTKENLEKLKKVQDILDSVE